MRILIWVNYANKFAFCALAPLSFPLTRIKNYKPQDGLIGMLKIDCVIFKLEDCAACSRLMDVLGGVLDDHSKSDLKHKLAIHSWYYGSPCTFSPAAMVRPRLFPTLIAFKDGIARLGWEGFALVAPSEIQADMVLEILEHAAALADTSATMEVAQTKGLKTETCDERQ